MPAVTTLLLFALATFLLTVSPGPGVLYVTARSLAQGRRAGFASMFGIELGEVVWIAAAATGVAALLSASAATLEGLRLAGAGYLVYLGIQRWRQVGSVRVPQPAPLGRIFVQGCVTQLLNPKVAVFFVAFLPQFISPAAPVSTQLWILAVTFVVMATINATLYALFAVSATKLLSSPRAQRRFQFAGGSLLSAAGIWALLARHAV